MIEIVPQTICGRPGWLVKEMCDGRLVRHKIRAERAAVERLAEAWRHDHTR